MLKRFTKVTSLLVGVASVISIIPANAADYKKVEAEEGTIYNAIAKGKGIYLEGEINGKDDAEYYISEDGEYHEIDGLSAGDAVTDLLVNKYLEIDSNTYVDITDNYKVLDETVRENLEDDAAIALKKKIKADNDGRFSKSCYEGSEVEATKEGSNKFLSSGSGLAIYNYTLKKEGIGTTTAAVYSDLQGNYVDADYNLGSIKVSTTTGSSVNIKNTEDTYEIKQDGKTYELKAEIKETKYLTDVSDDIYRLAKLTIYKREKGGSDSDWVAATDQLEFGGKQCSVPTNSDNSATVVQKFSKTADSDTIDGIKYSKNSAVYFIADEDGNEEYLLGKSGDAAKKLGDVGKGTAKITANAQGMTSIFADTENGTIYAENIKLKSKNGFNYVDIGDMDDADLDSNMVTTGGLPYFISGGYIKTWDGSENFTKAYKVDGSMTNISASSKDNMIVWNEDDEVYSVIHNATAKTDTTATTTSSSVTTTESSVTAGWVQSGDNWNYILSDGSKAVGWVQSSASKLWYYMDKDGNMASDKWVSDNGTWYYLSKDGTMVTGWFKDANGSWYYLKASGAMAHSEYIDGYYLDDSGKCTN